jgi:hypothetical protein
LRKELFIKTLNTRQDFGTWGAIILSI